MSSPSRIPSRPTVGIIGFGAFGRLVAQHLAPYVDLRVYDPFQPHIEPGIAGVVRSELHEAARSSVVVLATPVSRLADAVAALAPHLLPGTLVVDVGSVKVLPVEIMNAGLPPHVEILATHPLFGPQSAAAGIAGLKIAVCPIRGSRGRRIAAFLRRVLRLKVIVTTPEEHDREAAAVQGLTHLIAKVLVSMEPLPTRMTTRSFELIMQAVDMVRYDAPEVFQAIERSNPYSAGVRQRFFALAAQLDAELSCGRG
ncbi:MAG: prephenate dehydrogenase [Rhodospirillales bacterium]|nr:prephenate dehydrogenase [Rhodospirillales bacterium]